MKKMLLLSSIALLCASFAWAQQTGAPADPSSSSSVGASPSSGAIQGCVSGDAGNYMLTQDGTGATYKLVGQDDKVASHVGHEVMVTGQLTNAGSAASASDQGQGSSSTSTAGGSAIQVSDVKMISKHCSQGTSPAQPR